MIIQAGDDPLKGQITLSQWEADSRSVLSQRVSRFAGTVAGLDALRDSGIR